MDPKYVVIYNITSPDGWVSFAKEFFDSYSSAALRYGSLMINDQSPTLREYNKTVDFQVVLYKKSSSEA